MFSIPLPWPESSLLLHPQWAWLPAVVRGLVLCGVVAVPLVLLVWLYRFELRLVPRLTALSLLALRVAVLLLVLFVVCLQPIFARDRVTELPGRILVAVDRSTSMDVPDRQREGADKLRLARALGLALDVSDALLASWIADHDRKRDPTFVSPDEKRDDPAGRAKLQDQRRKTHDALIEKIDNLTRADVARLVLGDGVKLLASIREKHVVDLLGFHQDLWELKADQLDELFRVPGEPGELATSGGGALPPVANASGSFLAANGFTDLRAPLIRALERTGPGQGKILGIVLLTDGQHNSGPPPAAKARELGERKVPIYPIALGERQAPPDAAIVSVRGPNHTVFKDVEAMIDVRIKISGLPAGEYVVELNREVAAPGASQPEKKALGQKTIQHDGKDRVYTESFPVKMEETGTQTLAATIKAVRPDVKETRLDNNRLATTISVADDRAKVLLVDGEARWEYHYLATALQRDRLIDLKSIVFEQPRLDQRLTSKELEEMGSPAQEWLTGPDALASYQAIVLGDVSPEKLTLAERQRLERYVADGGGTLIVLAGKRFMPLAYPDSLPSGESDPFRRLLPIESPRVLSPEDGFPLTLTRSGREARFMDLDPERDENELLWAGNPRPWSWAVAGNAKPGATPLAGWLNPTEEGLKPSEREKHNAVIVRHNYGFGRVLFIGVDSTWRWRYKVGDLYHHRFWGQVLRWAAADKPLSTGNQFVRFGSPQPVYRPGEVVEVVGRLNDNLGNLKPDLLAGARIVRLPDDPRGAEKPVALVPLTRRPAQPRVLEGKVRDLPGGRYAIELAIPDLADRLMAPAEHGKNPVPLRAVFTMLPPESKEMIDLETNWPLLDDLAVQSGGKVFTPLTAGELRNLLVKQSVPNVEHHEQRLWQWWGLLVVVVLLLTLEWVGRKMAGLP
jgi:hypothetical protein